TNGTALDIAAVPQGQAAALTGLNTTALGLATNSELRATFGSGQPLELYRVGAGTPVSLGTVSIQGSSALGVSPGDAPLDSGGTIGMGVTTPGGGALTKTLTIKNTGSEPLTLGIVTITGPGYTVTQPGQTTLPLGADTTFSVTLSDATAGIGITGTLTVPSND